MPKKNIDLGYSYKDTMPESLSEMKDEKMYPSFRVESDEKIDFPHEGTMTVHFKKTRSEEGEGKYSCTIEVHRIVSMYGDADSAPYKRDKSTEEALDALANKKKDDDDESDY